MSSVYNQIRAQVKDMLAVGSSDIIQAWNDFTSENHYGLLGYLTCDKTNDFFSTPADLAKAIYSGRFNLHHTYYLQDDMQVRTFDTLDGEDSLLDIEQLVLWLEQNENWLSYGIYIESIPTDY